MQSHLLFSALSALFSIRETTLPPLTFYSSNKPPQGLPLTSKDIIWSLFWVMEWAFDSPYLVASFVAEAYALFAQLHLPVDLTVYRSKLQASCRILTQWETLYYSQYGIWYWWHYLLRAKESPQCLLKLFLECTPKCSSKCSPKCSLNCFFRCTFQALSCCLPSCLSSCLSSRLSSTLSSFL